MQQRNMMIFWQFNFFWASAEFLHMQSTKRLYSSQVSIRDRRLLKHYVFGPGLKIESGFNSRVYSIFAIDLAACKKIKMFLIIIEYAICNFIYTYITQHGRNELSSTYLTNITGTFANFCSATSIIGTSYFKICAIFRTWWSTPHRD